MGRMLALTIVVLFFHGLMAADPTLAGIGAHVGYGRALDSEGGATFLGAHLEIPVPLLRFLTVQGALDYRHVETLDVELPGESGEVEVRSLPITVTGRAYVRATPSMRVFGAAGAGWYFMTYDYSGIFAPLDDDSDLTFGWHLGAGVQFEPTKSMALYGEARFIFADPDRDLSAELQQEIENFDYDSAYFAVGVTFGR